MQYRFTRIFLYVVLVLNRKLDKFIFILAAEFKIYCVTYVGEIFY